MNYLGKVFNNCKYIYNEINAATLTGAIDVVVVEQPDGSYTCSPFHVRFGKIGVLRSKEKVVDIEINGEPMDIHMKLGESGEAFFVEEVAEGEGEDNFIPPHLACSPIPPDGDRFNQSDWSPSLEERDLGAHDVETPEETSGPQSTPKTFKAETVEDSEDGVRKLGTPEFRPITGGSSTGGSQNTESSASSKESIDFVKEDSPSDETSTMTVSKRKRRKKSIKKKNNAQKRNSVGAVPTEPPIAEKVASSEAIFQMEDLDINAMERTPTSPDKVGDRCLDLPSVQELPTTAVDRGDIHFFSDTEITPGSSPRDEYAPVQSDSEFETKRLIAGVVNEVVQNGGADDHPQSWRWGELPTPEPEDKKQESQRWMLHNMLGFMKKTKHMRHKTENEGGIYLSEVNSEDPEMAALYFPNHFRHSNPPPTSDYADGSREEDAESGNGPSLPQSPHSVEGAICGPKPDDFETKQQWYPEDIALSLCGVEAPESFQEHQVTFNDMVADPNIMNNPKLVIRLEGKIYAWKVAAPIVMSMLVFRKPLPQEVVFRLTGETVQEEAKQDKVKAQRKVYYSSWFTWSRIDQQNYGEDKQLSGENEASVKSPSEPDTPLKAENSIDEAIEPLDISNRSIDSDHSLDLKQDTQGSVEKYRKSLRLSSEQIAKLKLHPGANEVVFSVTTAYQGTSRCKCFLFCWRYDDKIVVSDIDGTITKSDVLGHILPIVGKDWAQSGVAKLFTKIKENGYKLLYLSARAIGQSKLTREYLKSIKQEDLTLPEGPMLLNPTSLLNAFHTEVIEKKPEEFKISCLRDIQALFPQHIKPFYAGYGNKINDVWAYQAIGIPIFRIFTINHRGELKHELTQTFQSTYLNMSGLVDQMFPASKPLSSEDFSEFAYWRDPVLEIEALPEFTSQVKN